MHTILYKQNNVLQHNGTRAGELKQLLLDFPASGGWLVVDPASLPADFSTETYTIIDGQLVRASDELIAERQAIKQTQDNAAEIARLQDYLISTDYAAIKCGELGLAMSSEYPELHAERTAARARINELQKGGRDA